MCKTKRVEGRKSKIIFHCILILEVLIPKHYGWLTLWLVIFVKRKMTYLILAHIFFVIPETYRFFEISCIMTSLLTNYNKQRFN